MLARRGVAVCILAFVVTTLVALLAIGRDDVRVLYALAPYLLLFYAGLAFLASEARTSLQGLEAGGLGRLSSGERMTGVDDLVGMLDDTLKLARDIPGVDKPATVDLRDVLIAATKDRDGARVRVVGSREPLRTFASHAALQRAFEILIENALSNAARVNVACDHGTSALMVHVDDDGPGISRTERANIFDWRYYMSTPPSQQVGCRAELVIARQIARAHGGDITVGASPMGGARFSVRLPLAGLLDVKLVAAS